MKGVGCRVYVRVTIASDSSEMAFPERSSCVSPVCFITTYHQTGHRFKLCRTSEFSLCTAIAGVQSSCVVDLPLGRAEMEYPERSRWVHEGPFEDHLIRSLNQIYHAISPV